MKQPSLCGGSREAETGWRGDEDKTCSHIMGSTVLSDQTANKQTNSVA